MEFAKKFFPTERLKIVMEEKGIKNYIPEDGRDPNPAWDHVARALWPSIWPSMAEEKDEEQANRHRESLANQLMWGSYDEVVADIAPEAAIIMARMAQNLCGKTWMKNWVLKNEGTLRKRVKLHKQNYGDTIFQIIWKKIKG